MTTPLRLVVIGGVAAGAKAASKARRDDPGMDITLVTDDRYVSYAGCGLAYYIGGLSPREGLFARAPEAFRDKQRIDMRLRHRADRIDTASREVYVTDIGSGEAYTLPYDRLLVATGAAAAVPDVPGMDTDGVFPLHRIPDADAIRAYIAGHGVTRACIIGGGYIGMELPENLAACGVASTLIERAGTLLPGMLDPDMSEHIRTHLTEQGVNVVTGTALEAVTGGNGGVDAVVAGGREYPCDMVIAVTGIRPNVALARAAGIAIGPTGAIATNARMETSMPHIYAAGDCAESRHIVTGKPVWQPLGSTANQHGRVAGANIAGENATFAGLVGTSIVKVYEFAAGRTGVSEREAVEAGFDPVSAMVTTSSRAGYYPGGQKLTLRIAADRATGRLLGLQAVGRESVDKVLDTAAAALTGGLTLDRLANLDLAYSPPFSRAIGALIVAAQVLEGKGDVI